MKRNSAYVKEMHGEGLHNVVKRGGMCSVLSKPRQASVIVTMATSKMLIFCILGDRMDEKKRIISQQITNQEVLCQFHMRNYINNDKLFFSNTKVTQGDGRVDCARHGRGKHAARVPASPPHAFQANKKNYITRVSNVLISKNFIITPAGSFILIRPKIVYIL